METTHKRLSAQARRRLLGGDLIVRGFTNDEIVEITEASLSSVKRWRATIQSAGLQGLARKPQSGRPARLDATQKAELKTILGRGAILAGYLTDRWTTKIVADLIIKKWGITYSRPQVSRILHSLGLSCQKPDVQSTKRSQAAIDHWRHYVWPRLKKSGRTGFDAGNLGRKRNLLYTKHRYDLGTGRRNSDPS